MLIKLIFFSVFGVFSTTSALIYAVVNRLFNSSLFESLGEFLFFLFYGMDDDDSFYSGYGDDFFYYSEEDDYYARYGDSSNGPTWSTKAPYAPKPPIPDYDDESAPDIDKTEDGVKPSDDSGVKKPDSGSGEGETPTPPEYDGPGDW